MGLHLRGFASLTDTNTSRDASCALVEARHASETQTRGRDHWTRSASLSRTISLLVMPYPAMRTSHCLYNACGASGFCCRLLIRERTQICTR
jgi:hypothetical protein